jgi:methylenetetrahydrofolate dehydrogenase (NADP+)/methenyltetrahydrofolate cyclohydrolase
MAATIIDGKAIALKMHQETAETAAKLAEEGWAPRLVSVSVGDTAAAELYVRNQQRQAEASGVTFEARSYPQRFRWSSSWACCTG